MSDFSLSEVRRLRSKHFKIPYGTGLMVAAITRFKRMIFNRKVLFSRVEINE
jgi:hypothetical protein